MVDGVGPETQGHRSRIRDQVTLETPSIQLPRNQIVFGTRQVVPRQLGYDQELLMNQRQFPEVPIMGHECFLLNGLSVGRTFVRGQESS